MGRRGLGAGEMGLDKGAPGGSPAALSIERELVLLGSSILPAESASFCPLWGGG